MRSVLQWLFHPWSNGGDLRGRVGRIYAVTGALSLGIIPLMILHYGADGWLWHITASVVFCAPLGIVALDIVADRVLPKRTRGFARLLVLFVGLAAGIFLGYAVQIAFPMSDTPNAQLLLKDYRRSMSIVTVVVTAISAGGALLWYRGEALRFEGAMTKASLHTLQRQLEPHFLFNALASLKELIASDPELATKVTQQLANVYRVILEASERPTIPLEQELALVTNYLEIEQVRYGERLRYEVDVPTNLLGRHVPSLVLQTLVENAVKHGIRKARKGGAIVVRASADGDDVHLVVSNTGAPYEPKPAGVIKEGRGLANTVARLDMMYGAGHRFSIAAKDTGDAPRTDVSFYVLGGRS